MNLVSLKIQQDRFNGRESNILAGAPLRHYNPVERYFSQHFGVNWYIGNSLLMFYYNFFGLFAKPTWKQRVAS